MVVEELAEAEAGVLKRKRIRREPSRPTVSWWCLRRGWKEDPGEAEGRRTTTSAAGCVFVD